MPEFADYATAFLRNAERDPERLAVRFFRGAGERCTEESLSYGELDRAARATAVALAERCAPGDRVLLSFPPGPDFVKAFLGCQYAGVVPVPVPPPAGTAYQADRTAAIAADADPAVVLTDGPTMEPIARRLAQGGLEHLGRFTIEEAEAADPGAWTGTRTRSDDLSFLQYTSGSTSDPKGVMVSHSNLFHNAGLMRRSHGWDRDTGFFSWLPVYHDMGLVAMLLTPLLLGGTAALMPAVEFLKRPRRWPELIDLSGAAVSCAPNFAYELCARRVTDEEAAGLDLSRWRFACNGAEPIASATLDRFAARFAAAGFRPEAFLPGYGLAEATLYVSGARAGSGPVVTRVDAGELEQGAFVPDGAVSGRSATLVSSGVVRDLDVRVVDPETAEPVPDGRVGEVWIRGRSVARGYWRSPGATRLAFGAATAGGEGGFLRTGDLGARHRGELYITGRLKEMLIVNGRNLYPHDIERLVEDAGAAFAGLPRCAFSVPAPQEEIVVVQEVRARGLDAAALRELAREISSFLAPRLGVRVANVVLVRIGRVSRTTSGKVRRLRMRELFMSGELDGLHEELDPGTRAAYRGTPVVGATAEHAGSIG